MDKAIHVNKRVFWFNPNIHINIYATNVNSMHSFFYHKSIFPHENWSQNDKASLASQIAMLSLHDYLTHFMCELDCLHK